MSVKQAVQNTIDYIEEHLQEDLDLDRIARHAAYSKYHLERLFSQEMGCTIYQYIRERRLSLAADQLAEGEDAISWIAIDAGYTSQQAFSLAFKRRYGITPRKYRDKTVSYLRKSAVLRCGRGKAA